MPFTEHRTPQCNRRTAERKARSKWLWTQVSREVRRSQVWCADPFGKHRDVPATIESVHHIEPIKQRPDLAYEFCNLIGLCRECHEDCEDAGDDRRLKHRLRRLAAREESE